MRLRVPRGRTARSWDRTKKDGKLGDLEDRGNGDGKLGEDSSVMGSDEERR